MNVSIIHKTFSDRKEQLQYQKYIDATLKHFSELSQIHLKYTLNYLFLQRELNRSLSKQYENNSFWNYFHIATRHINFIEKEQKCINNILKGKIPLTRLLCHNRFIKKCI